MNRSLLAMTTVMTAVMSVVVPAVLVVSAASAQPGKDACARDVSRFCRAVSRKPRDRRRLRPIKPAILRSRRSAPSGVV